MFTLFIDTHGENIVVALCSQDDLFVKEQKSEFSHAVYLAPMIRDILKTNGVTFKDIKDIVAVNGPGSFTGLRIGLSEAKTIAYSLDIPIYLVSTLDAYLVSDGSLDAVSILCDNKGYYVKECIHGKMGSEVYLNDISDYNNKHVVLEKLDVRKVILYALKSERVNPHLVRANYVKNIEVLK